MQVAACHPSRLVLLEKHEESLFHIEGRLRGAFPSVRVEAMIGDIRDEERVDEIFGATQPEVVFHAAAYKHVPMMERNPREALKTNVRGTEILAEAAGRHGVQTFAFISTDKAVEPVCVMGATKRLAELTLRQIAPRSQTRFITVRFGNVLGSSGSVIPTFRDQIARRVPVTVTHPDVTRWFMTVPEAVHLILESVTIGGGGEVFVLDMGKPVRVLDLARSLIRQHGLEPDRDIPIVYTGLRPGERLFEKLFNDHETICKTEHPRILMAVERHERLNGHAGAIRDEERLRLLRMIESAELGTKESAEEPAAPTASLAATLGG
jgi:FlaA1/EpsC-like NDP-sugar epimerase